MIIAFELEGISFNASHYSTFTKEKFIESCLKENLFSNFSNNDQKKLLNQAFAGIKAAVSNHGRA